MKLVVFLSAQAFLLVAEIAASPKVGLHSGIDPKRTFHEILDFADQQGIDRIQFTPSHLDPMTGEEALSGYVSALETHRQLAYSLWWPDAGNAESNRRAFELAMRLKLDYVSVDLSSEREWNELLYLSDNYSMPVSVVYPAAAISFDSEESDWVIDGERSLVGVSLHVSRAVARGLDPSALLRERGNAIREILLNDFRKDDQTGRVYAVLPGRGEANYRDLFLAIEETNWSGNLTVGAGASEFSKDPAPYVSQSLAFIDTRRRFAGYDGSMDMLERLIPHRMPGGMTEAEEVEIQSLAIDLNERIRNLERAGAADDRVADVAIFLKLVEWSMRYETEWTSRDVRLARAALDRGRERAASLSKGRSPWARQSGRVLRGYRSKVDGSYQLFGLVLPEGYDSSRRYRLDVVLHGSIRQTGTAMLRFSNWFERPRPSYEGDFIALYPLGRVTNAYRWAGETDVFDAIDAVTRQYAVDEKQIVLRGFSMGASGTWHIGLKRPDRFAALGPYTGFVDTRRFSEGENARLVRIGSVPAHQEKMFSLLDAIGYARNAASIPAIAAIGEDDIGFRNHQFMADAYAAEGMQMVNLVSQGTAHRVDEVTLNKQMELIELLMRGSDGLPERLSFVTYSLAYNRCHWVSLTALEEHYRKAEFTAELADNARLLVRKTENIKGFEIDRSLLPSAIRTVEIGDKSLEIGTSGPRLSFQLDSDGWTITEGTPAHSHGKRPKLQGPIDDAFTGPFLCVMGTGESWSPVTRAWAEATLRRFAYEWNRYMVGKLPVKRDFEVTENDIRSKNLILFGDPGSNSVVRRVLPLLPMKWTPEALEFDGIAYPASTHVPVLINPNSLAEGSGKYVVLNSGHTFHEEDFSTVAYLLFPRLGDWAIIKAGESVGDWLPGAGPFPETVVTSGLFDESWRGTLPQEN